MIAKAISNINIKEDEIRNVHMYTYNEHGWQTRDIRRRDWNGKGKTNKKKNWDVEEILKRELEERQTLIGRDWDTEKNKKEQKYFIQIYYKHW